MFRIRNVFISIINVLITPSNVFIAIINCFTTLIGVAAIAASMYLRFHGDSECQKFLQKSLLILGLLFFIFSLPGLIGSICRICAALCVYLAVMFFVIIGLVVFINYSFLVSNVHVREDAFGSGYYRYRSVNYTDFLRAVVANEENWIAIKSCLIDAKICRNLNSDVRRYSGEFVDKNFALIRSGCCWPPSKCGFKHNPTMMVVPKSGAEAPHADYSAWSSQPDTLCYNWSSQPDTLCYNCASCKKGVLNNIIKEWGHFGTFSGFVLLVVTVTFCVGCCAVQPRTKYDRNRTYP